MRVTGLYRSCLSLIVTAAVGLSLTSLTLCAAQQSEVGKTEGKAVLVELFTSEGCSSCPPADALLAKLDAAGAVNGVPMIVLSEHVTYWDHLGWRDPFSMESMTERQRMYSARFGLDDVYTPQIVVDGSVEMVGSDARKVANAVTQAAGTAKGQLKIQSAAWSGNRVNFSVQGVGIEGKGSLTAVLAEDSVQSAVARGENAGRNLRHVAVVRSMKEMGGSWRDGGTLAIEYPSAAGKDGGRSVRLVVFVAENKSGHVIAAAEQTISR